jgi:hypothetical protein
MKQDILAEAYRLNFGTEKEQQTALERLALLIGALQQEPETRKGQEQCQISTQ